VEKAPDEDLLKLLGGNEIKLAEVRRAIRNYREQDSEVFLTSPILPPYKP
jgi:hypothetical protein